MTTAQLFLGLFLLAITLGMIFVICRAAHLSEKAHEQALRGELEPKATHGTERTMEALCNEPGKAGQASSDGPIPPGCASAAE